MSFKAFWQSAKELFDELFALAIVNLIWVVINLPLALIAGMLLLNNALGTAAIVALLAVVPMAPATAGLYAVAQRVTEGRVISWRVFFEGFREYRMISWQVYGLWALGLALILVNIQFYLQLNSTIGSFLTILFLYLLAIWFALLIYIGPLMLLQTDKRLRVIARNAFLMVLGRPVFTLSTVIMMMVIIVVSVFLRLLPFLLTFAFLALWSLRATMALIADAEARRLAREEAAAKAAGNRANVEKGRGGQIRPRD